jgi:hypothetical protein
MVTLPGVATPSLLTLRSKNLAGYRLWSRAPAESQINNKSVSTMSAEPSVPITQTPGEPHAGTCDGHATNLTDDCLTDVAMHLWLD